MVHARKSQLHPVDKSRALQRGLYLAANRIAQQACKIVIEPLFEAEFRPCSFGFRPKRTTRMALGEIVSNLNAGYTHVVDVDLKGE